VLFGTEAATGDYTFRALVTDVAGNTADSTFTMVYVSLDVEAMKPYSNLGGAESTPPNALMDSQFALQSADFELDLSQTNPSDAKASELGNALSSYLESGLDVQTSVEPLGLAPLSRLLESVPALANALSDYQIANIGLVKSDQAADLLRKVKETSEAYPKPILAPPNGSS
jgi:hypothetical protein